MEAKDFCTCGDYKCPNNPVNHEKGCTLCVLKCLKANEIPTCFFKKLFFKMLLSFFYCNVDKFLNAPDIQ